MFSFYRGIRGEDFFHLHDPLALAVALDRSLAQTRGMSLDVEISGELTRGMIVAEQRAWKHPAPNAEVAITADQERFLSNFSHRVLGK
jgi:purine nucleosidase